MSKIKLDILEYKTCCNTPWDPLLSGYGQGQSVQIDIDGSSNIIPVVYKCVILTNACPAFGGDEYIVEKRVCSNINGVLYWQSPEEIQKLINEVEGYETNN